MGSTSAPELYADERHASVQASRPDRDSTELAIARATAGTDLPVLGICRGMQVMAVAAGGLLEQHLPDRVGHDEHSPAPATYGSHAGAHRRRDPARRILGEEADVPSYHHQSVLTHPGYEAVGVGRRRHAGGDGGPGLPSSGSRSSGTPRSAPTRASSGRSSRRP